jgi:DNA-binding transcriptional LysR family regulator
LELHLEEHPSSMVLEALEAGRADVGVVSGVRVPNGWDSYHFRADRLVLLAPAGHPLVGGAGVVFADVLDAPFVGLDEGSGIQQFVEGAAVRAGQRLRVVVRVRSFDAVVRLVEHGAGVAVIPGSCVARLGSEHVRAVPLVDAWAERLLQVVLPPTRYRSAAVQAVVDGLLR